MLIQASACIISTNISLVKASHVVNLRLKAHRNSLLE